MTAKPETNYYDNPAFHKQSFTKGVRVSRRSRLSPTKFLKRTSDKITTSLNFASRCKKSFTSRDTSSEKSNPAKAPMDTYFWAEVIIWCITEFIVEFIEFDGEI